MKQAPSPSPSPAAGEGLGRGYLQRRSEDELDKIFEQVDTHLGSIERNAFFSNIYAFPHQFGSSARGRDPSLKPGYSPLEYPSLCLAEQ